LLIINQEYKIAKKGEELQGHRNALGL